jgi:choline-sulfatase
MKVQQERFVAGVLVLGCVMAAAQPNASPRSADSRPNILLILTDQQRADMLSCAGNRYLRTPALDGLATRGVRFERAYCANPVCVPSRFAMMTGVMPSGIGMEFNDHITNAVPASLLAHSLGVLFRDAGYDTVYGGKVHLPSAGPDGGPETYGFRRLTADEREGLADTCASFLRQPHERPFLLVASFINPHDICYVAINAYAAAHDQKVVQVPALQEALALPPGMSRAGFFKTVCPPLPDNFGITDGEPPAVRQSDWRPFRAYVQARWTDQDWRLHRWAYARLTERVDVQIGTVLKALHDSGRERDTVVVFTSDHGDMDSAHHMEHKSMPYEEAIHVPLIISGPGVTATGRVDRLHWVSSGLDLIPTLCDFAGIPAPPSLKGRSLKPLVTGTALPAWRATLVIENERSRVLRSEGCKYAVYDSGQNREMLFDLEHDPGEMHNLAADRAHRSVLEEERVRLRAWYDANSESLPERYRVTRTSSRARNSAAERR